jgi:hypothetical protein
MTRRPVLCAQPRVYLPWLFLTLRISPNLAVNEWMKEG